MRPECYNAANCRCVLPVDASGVGLAFDLSNGQTIRFGLDLHDAKFLSETLAEGLRDYERGGVDYTRGK